jgi:hypothetical protein
MKPTDPVGTARFDEATVQARLDALTPPDAHGARVTQETLRKVVESWAAEGPRSRARKVEPRTEAA